MKRYGALALIAAILVALSGCAGAEGNSRYRYELAASHAVAGRQGEIEGLCFDRKAGQLLLLYNQGARIILGMPSGFYEGYTEEIHEVFLYTVRS